MIHALIAIFAIQGLPICQDAETTIEIENCVHTVYARSDERMTTQWRLALERMRKADKESGKRKQIGFGYADALLDSQRKWLAFRDAQCRIESYRMRGGSGQGYSAGLCLIRLTEERAKMLGELNF